MTPLSGRVEAKLQIPSFAINGPHPFRRDACTLGFGTGGMLSPCKRRLYERGRGCIDDLTLVSMAVVSQSPPKWQVIWQAVGVISTPKIEVSLVMRNTFSLSASKDC